MKYKINLLILSKQRPFERLVYFMINYLRYILVITQIVVIAVFFYRFKVDQELVDLQEAVDQKKEIIQVSQPLIKEAKKEAARIDQLESIIITQNTFIKEINYLLSRFPENFFLNKLSVFKDTITMNGYTQDPQAIKLFFDRIKKESKFNKIELQNIKRSDLGLEFTFELSNYKAT